MKVLITGHQGYIGPIAVKLFKDAGHHVTGLDIGYYNENIVDGETVVKPDNEILRDIREVQKSDLEGIEAIVHLSALSNDPMGELSPDLTNDINFKSSANLAKLAKESGVQRFIFASSCSIYGAAGDSDKPLDETAEFNPVSAYAHSKVNTEAALNELADDSFSPVFMRNATAFGVSPRIRFDLVLNNLMAWAHTTGNIRVMSDGTPWRPLVHIEDIALATLCAVQAPRETIHNQPFNIGHNEANYQVKDIAEAVSKQVPDATLEITGESGGDSRSYKVNFSKALNGLEGFSPKWTLEKGAEELDRWFKDGKLADKQFDSRNFIRLKQLKHLIESGQIDSELRLANAQSLAS